MQDSVGTGVLTNHGTGDLSDYTLSVSMTMSGEDSGFMSVMLRSDARGRNAVEARLNWTSNSVEVGRVRGGNYEQVNSLNFTEATGRGLWDEVTYRVEANATGDSLLLTVRGPESLAALSAEGGWTELPHTHVGLKGRDGPSGDKNLFDDLLLVPGRHDENSTAPTGDGPGNGRNNVTGPGGR